MKNVGLNTAACDRRRDEHADQGVGRLLPFAGRDQGCRWEDGTTHRRRPSRDVSRERVRHRAHVNRLRDETVLPVGLVPADDEVPQSFIARVAAANHESPSMLTVALAQQSLAQKSRLLRLPEQQVAAALALYPKPDSPWEVKRHGWHCPTCLARTGVWRRRWRDSLYSACESCRTLLVSTSDSGVDPIPVSTAFIANQRAFRRHRDQRSELHGVFDNACMRLLLVTEDDWPQPRSAEGAAVRRRDEWPLVVKDPWSGSVTAWSRIVWRRFTTPVLSAVITQLAWCYAITGHRHAFDIDDFCADIDELAPSQRTCGCPRAATEPGGPFDWIGDGADDAAAQLTTLVTSAGLGARHVPLIGPCGDRWGSPASRTARLGISFLLHATLWTIETGQAWTPSVTTSAFGTDRFGELAQLTDSDWCREHHLGDIWDRYIAGVSIDGEPQTDPGTCLAQTARQLVADGLVDYQRRRDAFRDESDLEEPSGPWSAQAWTRLLPARFRALPSNTTTIAVALMLRADVVGDPIPENLIDVSAWAHSRMGGRQRRWLALMRREFAANIDQAPTRDDSDDLVIDLTEPAARANGPLVAR